MIDQSFRRSVEGIIETGRLLLQARDDLSDRTFNRNVISKVSFSWRTAQRLMKIASHPFLVNATNLSHLPLSQSALYELSRIPDPVLEREKQRNNINSSMTAKDVKQLGHDRLIRARRSISELIKIAESYEPRELLGYVDDKGSGPGYTRLKSLGDFILKIGLLIKDKDAEFLANASVVDDDDEVIKKERDSWRDKGKQNSRSAGKVTPSMITTSKGHVKVIIAGAKPRNEFHEDSIYQLAIDYRRNNP